MTWEVTDVTQLVAGDQRGIRWDYTVVLRETAGVGVQFQAIELTASGGQLMASTARRDFKRRLAPRSELRFNDSYSVVWTANVSSAFGNIPGVRESYTRHLTLSGVSDAGFPITVRIRVPLDARTGHRLEPPNAPGRLPPARDLQPGDLTMLAGTWRGFYRNPDNIEIPAQLLVREDGSFDATEGDPVRNRFRGSLQIREGRVSFSTRNDTGTLTLHEAGERRLLVGSGGGKREGPPGTPPTTFSYSLYLEAVALVATPPGAPASSAPGPPSSSAASPPQVSVDLTGIYRGQVAGEVEGRLFTNQLTFTVVQNGREVSGTWATETGAGTLVGTVLSTAHFSFRISQTRPCPAEFSGVGTIADRAVGGSYGGVGCSGPFRATFSVSRQ
ncbi:MAG: hypothetical protein HY002_06745 [Candidatus Rokubacteria bacterium]|nr:hypothetical protein [Candidatus Rokubacteria bacterium]